MHYDKFTYAVKRRGEKELSPSRTSGAAASRDPPSALYLNRDGFAVAEDGSLMSRIVSPPRAECARPYSPKAATKEAAKPGEECWKRLVHAATPDFTEAELAQLSWETVCGLLQHYKLDAPVDVARCQLAWKARQPTEAQTSDPQGDDAALCTVKSASALRTASIEQLAYGRPASPRGHHAFAAKPLKWRALPRVDSGVHKK